MIETSERLDEWMTEHGVTVEPRYIGETTDPEGWQHHEWRFRLEVNGELLLDNARYGAGLAITDVSPADIFGSVVSDCQSIASYDDWLDWAEDLGWLESADGARKARDAHREITARASLLREQLGDETFSELLDETQL